VLKNKAHLDTSKATPGYHRNVEIQCWPKLDLRGANLIRRGLFLLCLCGCILVSQAHAGPPFQTDDPVPVDLRHYEAYLFGTFDHSGGSTSAQLPAFEFNVGAAPNLQLHIVVPIAYVNPDGAYGVGDVELGAKYRFVQETKTRPQIGVFPFLELPTGDSNRGLGNGQTWARLPVWLQKSAGPWTTYGGVGYQINHAPGMKDSVFGGWLVQRDLNKRITLGSEIYSQQAQAVGTRETTYWDGGGYLNFSKGLSLLFMGGHTIAGDRHTIGYLGLYYTWGPKEKGKPENSLLSGPPGKRP
jgi:hypothetical protein